MRKYGNVPPNSRYFAGVIVTVALILVGIVLTSAPPRTVLGVVQSAGARHVGKFNGRYREVAVVRLADGQSVVAFGKFADPLSKGDKVTLSEQPRMGTGPLYRVVAREQSVKR